MVLTPWRLRRRLRRRARRAGRPRWMKVLVLGVLLIGFGSYALLQRIWPDLPKMDQLWPLFLVVGGLLFLGSVVIGGFRRPEPTFPGVAALGVGSFFLLFTLGPLEYDQMSQLWPVFPLIGGVAFFWAWVASFGRRVGLLVPAVLSIGVGVVGLLFNLTPFGTLIALLGWPMIVLACGLISVFAAMMGLALRHAASDL